MLPVVYFCVLWPADVKGQQIGVVTLYFAAYAAIFVSPRVNEVFILLAHFPGAFFFNIVDFWINLWDVVFLLFRPSLWATFLRIVVNDTVLQLATCLKACYWGKLGHALCERLIPTIPLYGSQHLRVNEASAV